MDARALFTYRTIKKSILEYDNSPLDFKRANLGMGQSVYTIRGGLYVKVGIHEGLTPLFLLSGRVGLVS
jgi:hypothetical protein